MHETGLIRKLIQQALDEARRRDASLRGISVRLGALAGGTPEHLAEHFRIEADALGLSDLTLDMQSEPARPSGVEIVGLELSERESS